MNVQRLTDGSVGGHGQVLVLAVAVQSIAAVVLHEEDLHDAQIGDQGHAQLHQNHFAHPEDIGAAAIDVVI